MMENENVQNVKQTSSDAAKQGAFAAPKGVPQVVGLQGWVCPKCGRVYSPYTIMCPYCGKGGVKFIDIM